MFVHESSPTSNLSHSTVISTPAGRTLSCRPLHQRSRPLLPRKFPHPPCYSTVTTTKTRKFDHITPVLRALHWLSVRKRIVYKLAVMAYKCLHGLTLPYLAADCVPITLVASRRHLPSAESGCLAVTGTKTTLGRRNFAVTGAIIWNNLPADLRLHSQSLLSFGQKLKQYLFEP